MFGFLFGAACLAGLFAVIRRERWHRMAFAHAGEGSWAGPCGGPCGPGREHRHRHRHGGRRGFRGHFRDMALRRVFERLETSPGQERELQAAIAEIMDGGRKLRGQLADSRKEISKALRSEELDVERLGQLFSQHDDLLSEFRKTAVGALSRTHAALDEGQRAQLADWIDRGDLPFGGFRGEERW
ncbi:MAG: periplasmic heavy metal sensor [Myxococcales bacterium]|nr:periplasmic heavy metal sensor [Myxococcales bacterium]